MRLRLCVALLMAPSILVTQNFAYAETEIEHDLKMFRQSPAKFMNSLPRKSHPSSISPYSVEERQSLMLEKLAQRRQFLRSMKSSPNNFFNETSLDPQAPISGEPEEFATYDRVEELVETKVPIVVNLSEMSEKKLTKASIPVRPWSDDYWPIYKGALGARYVDAEFKRLHEWINAYDYVQVNKATNIYQLGDETKINLLSPSEKYDLLLGSDLSWLTDALWQQGKSYNDTYGRVEKWMGICHGWAAAAYKEKRPLKTVRLPSADGKHQILFYPADIRALLSLTWASNQSSTRLIGGRCGLKNVEYDSNGRILNKECFDVNPGSWHTSIVNQIGVNKNGFVIDATFDYEVWNQPVYSYEYTYFNPQTDMETESQKEATVSRENFTKDLFKKYRSKDAVSFVGIAMKVVYMLERKPTQAPLANPDKDDNQRTVHYLYDLELDAEGNIIGGEWYNNTHPDFLWTPALESRPMAYGDYHLLGSPMWDGKRPLDNKWIKFAKQSAKKGQVLNSITRSILNLATSN